MKNCAEIRDMISDYIDAELKLNEMRKVKKHFEICPACREEYEELKQISELCRDMEEAELPDNFKTELYKKLNIQSSKKYPGFYIGRYAKMVSTAAACLLIIFIARGFLDNPFRHDNPSLSTKSAVTEEATDGAMYGNGSAKSGAQNNLARPETAAQKSVTAAGAGMESKGRQESAENQQSNMMQQFSERQQPAINQQFAGTDKQEAGSVQATSTQLYDMAVADVYIAGFSSSDTAAPTNSQAMPEPAGRNADAVNQTNIQNSTPVKDEVPKEDAVQFKDSTLNDDPAGKTSGLSRTGLVSRSRYMEIRLTSNQNAFSESLAEKIKKLASDYNLVNTGTYAVKIAAPPGTAYVLKDKDTLEIKIEEGKEQEFLNKLNTMVNPEEGKITVNEIDADSFAALKQSPEQTVQSPDEQAKLRYTTIIIIFQQD